MLWIAHVGRSNVATVTLEYLYHKNSSLFRSAETSDGLSTEQVIRQVAYRICTSVVFVSRLSRPPEAGVGERPELGGGCRDVAIPVGGSSSSGAAIASVAGGAVEAGAVGGGPGVVAGGGRVASVAGSATGPGGHLEVLLDLGLTGDVGQHGGVAEDAVVQSGLGFPGLLGGGVTNQCHSPAQEQVEHLQGAVLHAQGFKGRPINLEG